MRMSSFLFIHFNMGNFSGFIFSVYHSNSLYVKEKIRNSAHTEINFSTQIMRESI